MRPLMTFLVIALLLVGLGFSLAFNASAQHPPAPPAQPSAWANLPTLSPTPQSWEKLATAQAASTQAAMGYTAVAEDTRVESQRQATATQGRIETQEAQALTPAAATAAFLKREIDRADSAATRGAALTQASDAVNAAFTQTAAEATNEFGKVVATEAARREAYATNMADVAILANVLGQICGAVFPLGLVALLFYGLHLFGPKIAFGLEARFALITSGPTPMQARRGEDGGVRLELIGSPERTLDAPARPALGTSRPPAVPAAHPDDPAAPARERVLNLIAAAIKAEGTMGTKIPRWHELDGYNSDRRGKLVGLLQQAGLVTVVSNKGTESGTFLNDGRTLYQLWVEIEQGRAVIPSPASGESIAA